MSNKYCMNVTPSSLNTGLQYSCYSRPFAYSHRPFRQIIITIKSQPRRLYLYTTPTRTKNTMSFNDVNKMVPPSGLSEEYTGGNLAERIKLKSVDFPHFVILFCDRRQARVEQFCLLPRRQFFTRVRTISETRSDFTAKHKANFT